MVVAKLKSVLHAGAHDPQLVLELGSSLLELCLSHSARLRRHWLPGWAVFRLVFGKLHRAGDSIFGKNVHSGGDRQSVLKIDERSSKNR